MASLYAFLHPQKTSMEKDVVISSRFLDEEGGIVPFKIRAISQEETDRLTKQSTKTIKGKENFDPLEFNRRVVVAGTVEPDFSDRELCAAYGVLDPLMVPGRMLLSGEFSALLSAISSLSGFGEEDEDEEAKN